MNKDALLEVAFGPLDPAAEFRFYVEIDGINLASFYEASGFSVKRDVLEVKEGGVNSYVHKLPGRTSYTDITLRRGITFSTQLWEWYDTGMRTGKVKRRDLTIIQYSAYFNIPARWYDVSNAFPVKWDGPTLNAGSTELAIEALTITFEKLEVRDWSSIDFAAKFASLGI